MKYVLFALASIAVSQFPFLLKLAQGIPVMRSGQCPTGTSTSGDVCVPRGDTQVFYNGGGPCPQGWTRSKNYCVR